MVTQTDLGHGRGWLTPEAAASLRRLDKVKGRPWQITEAGRTWARQNYHHQRYLDFLTGGPWAPIALPPGSSIHEFGRAIDTDQRETALLNEHGWFHTVFRGGQLVEPWHYEYFADQDKHRGKPAEGGAMSDAGWVKQRVGGSVKSGPTVTELLREINSKLDALALDQTWIKDRIGGSITRETTLSQDIDAIKKKTGA